MVVGLLPEKAPASACTNAKSGFDESQVRTKPNRRKPDNDPVSGPSPIMKLIGNENAGRTDPMFYVNADNFIKTCCEPTTVDFDHHVFMVTPLQKISNWPDPKYQESLSKL
ncbi:hypothetical protein PHLCEN_2v2192 [Hermanssonia centrifuga]|uniref:Uncharacterized protein n=1 Tax=Hermanssonia centrifuga TaxID=98765 RepID=A0A2R6RPU9_9APHY|nr:hypothetical protein PHLCEN_2v2192 [Hermanssonia centrifuga]